MLLVYRVDRLSRKVRQLATLSEVLDQLGVVLRSATEPVDTGSAAGRMMLAVFAEFEHARSSIASAPGPHRPSDASTRWTSQDARAPPRSPER